MKQYLLKYVTNSATNSCTCCYTHVDNKGDKYANLKYFNFKTSKNSWQIWKFETIILYIFKERLTVQHFKSFYFKYIPSFNELIIKNTHVQKISHFLFLWNRFTCLIINSYYKKLEPLITKPSLNFMVTVISTF